MISRPSPRRQRVCGVSLSVANFFANSSETMAFLAMQCSCTLQIGIQVSIELQAGPPPSGGLPDLSFEVFLDELGGEHDLGIVLGSVLDLLQIVQPAVLVDPVDRRDQPHRLFPPPLENPPHVFRRDSIPL